MSRAGCFTAAALYERHLDAVYDYVVQRVPTIEEAEDVTAEVFAAAAAGLSRFRGQCPPYLWLLSIARRQIARARRRRAVRRETLATELAGETSDAASIWEALAAVEGPEAIIVRAEAGQVLDQLVARLSPDQREALALQYLERLSIGEIAIVMGRSQASIKSLLQRARAALHRGGRAYFIRESAAAALTPQPPLPVLGEGGQGPGTREAGGGYPSPCRTLWLDAFCTHPQHRWEKGRQA